MKASQKEKDDFQKKINLLIEPRVMPSNGMTHDVIDEGSGET